MKTVSLSVLFICLFTCLSGFGQTKTPALVKNSEFVSAQNQVLNKENNLEDKKEINVIIDSNNDVVKSYQLLENKFRQLSVYKFRVLKA